MLSMARTRNAGHQQMRDDDRWQAVQDRDTSNDGAFVFAVARPESIAARLAHRGGPSQRMSASSPIPPPLSAPVSGRAGVAGQGRR